MEMESTVSATRTEMPSSLFLALSMLVIAYQVWARRRGPNCAIRKLVVFYTLLIALFELSRSFVDIHPFIHTMITGTHFIWEWAILGYMFMDSRATSVKGWLIGRIWMMLLSKGAALLMAFPPSAWLQGQATSITGDAWISHLLVGVILYRAVMCVRFWSTEAMIMRNTPMAFVSQTHHAYRNCRLNISQQRSLMSRLIS